MHNAHRCGAVAVALLLVAAACGGDDKATTGTTKAAPAQKQIGAGEGAVSILAWPYYAEDGTQDPNYDWVSKFETDTGCQARVKYFGTSDEAFTLFGTGDYDVVSASGDSSLRSVASGDAAPINTDLLTNYDDLAPFLKEQAWNSVDGTVYGVPHGWGANVLQYRTDVVSPAPDSWAALFDPNSPYAGKIAAYDSPIYIADAAVYLMATKPKLGIKNPYALDDTQFKAAVDLLKQQNGHLSEYWSDYVAYEDNYRAGSTVMGTSWQVIANTLQADKPPTPVDSVLPKEGSTAWSDNWMVHSKAQHPNCAYEWLNYITSPDVQAEVATTFGEAPANLKACDSIAEHCQTYHADDKAYYDQLHYWTTPTKKCLDGRTDVECKDYSEWVAAWTEIKG
ncbi:MAG: extracellular solute-binding protein family 1 [Acidimicrobiales bacterium]|nr:extracellular solute-binding protein family 1 [Acidimicrobiales bacterium]